MNQAITHIYRLSLSDTLHYDLALVRAGAFIMGSEGKDALDDEKT